MDSIGGLRPYSYVPQQKQPLQAQRSYENTNPSVSDGFDKASSKTGDVFSQANALKLLASSESVVSDVKIQDKSTGIVADSDLLLNGLESKQFFYLEM